jgi:hypothetical protein
MSIKTIKLAAALITAASSIWMMPALAGDQDIVTEMRDSGRYFGTDYTVNPQHLSGPYAFARSPRVRANAAAFPQQDFQLQGRD